MTSKKVHVLTTGGTIMSRSPNGLPGNAEIASLAEIFPKITVAEVSYETKEILSKGSANMIPEDWVKIAKAVETSIQSGVDGVVILHGTDTMQYTAAALSFMISDLPVPVVLTGAMIPMGNPETDGLDNLISAIKFAAFADIAEVCILFSEFDDRKIVIRGSRAKKIDSHIKSAFASVNLEPLGHYSSNEIEIADWRIRRSKRRVRLATAINPNVCLIKTHPALTSEKLQMILSVYDGAVLEGTGIGHIRVDDGVLDAIRNFGKPAALTTQCLYGGERLGVYAMDKKILAVPNIIPVRDMLPEVALVKLIWSLAQGREVRKLMLTNIAGEMSESSLH